MMSLKRQNDLTLLWVLGFVSTVVYAFILKLSFSFEPGSNPQNRPILTTLSLLGLAFVLYFGACYRVMQHRSKNEGKESQKRRDWFGQPVGVIFLFGIIFRLILLFSTPIQEVDIYRYVWDGLTTNQHVDPYQFPPLAVIGDVDFLKSASNPESVSPGITAATPDQDMGRLVRLAAAHNGVEKILREVNHNYLTTVYPPVSQWVFAATIRTVPVESSVSRFVLAIKLAIILFDLGTGVLVVVLLKKTGLPTTWSLVYLWCPLLMKEFANSGHLDSIAVFFCTAAAVATVFGLPRDRDFTGESWSRKDIRSVAWFSLAGVSLALAVGAKLYPAVVFPLWAVACCTRAGWRGLIPIGLFLVVVSFICWPMVRHTTVARQCYPAIVPTALHSWMTLPPEQPIQTRQPYPVAKFPSGIESFFESWEMNDLLFMIVVENLRVTRPAIPGMEVSSVPWFSLVEQDMRVRIERAVRTWSGQDVSAYSMARALTLAIFVVIVAWSCFDVVRNCTSKNFCRLAFLNLAWFWLLLPTQNPWYWTWALPLLVFARSRIWIFIAAATMLYYVRFYFEYHFTGQSVLGTPYEGVHFFDLVVPWVEFGPILLMLLAEWICCRKAV